MQHGSVILVLPRHLKSHTCCNTVNAARLCNKIRFRLQKQRRWISMLRNQKPTTTFHMLLCILEMTTLFVGTVLAGAAAAQGQWFLDTTANGGKQHRGSIHWRQTALCCQNKVQATCVSQLMASTSKFSQKGMIHHGSPELVGCHLNFLMYNLLKQFQL